MSTILVTPCARRSASATPATSVSAVLQRWRRQIASRSELAERRGPRPFALVGHRVGGRVADTLVPLERLSFVALFDERDEDDRLTTRLLACRPFAGTAGLRIGGPDNTLFDKDVRSAPCSGSGRRLDPQDAELCELALGWERHLERVDRHPHYPRRNVLRWPTWWCDVAAAPADVPTRRHGDRTLVSLEAAQACSLPIGRVFADVAGLPKRQVLAGADVRRLLCGSAGPVAFDLYHTRFRRTS